MSVRPCPLSLFATLATSSLPTEQADTLLHALPEQRRRQLLAIHNPQARRQGTLAYLLLCHALRTACAIDSPPTFSFLPNGKPLLAETPWLHFNLSHSRNAVACALATSPVGVDIESLRHASPALVARTMSPEEAQQILSSPCPDEEFTRLWTRKEASLKLTGQGLRANLPAALATPPSTLLTYRLGDAFLTLASADAIPAEPPSPQLVPLSSLFL